MMTSRAITLIVRPALILLTLCVALACILLLTSTLTQSRITSVSIDGVNVNIRKFEDVRGRWADLREQIRLKVVARDTETANQIALNAENQKFLEIYTPARTSIDADLQVYGEYIGAFDPKLGAQITDAEHLSPVERLNIIDFKTSDLMKQHPDITDKTKSIVAAGQTYKTIDQQRIFLKVKTQNFNAQSKSNNYNGEITALNDSLNSIFENFGHNVDASTRAKIENSFFELYTDDSIGHYLNMMIVAPPDILTLTLVVSMGILGSALQMTHALFVDNRTQTLGAYVLRLSVGAITALVIFIVTKAGVPVVADAARFGGDAPINPFFVSFLAIISGLMSENAIAFVEAQGNKVFSTSAVDDKMRWARADMHELFEKAGRKPEALRSILGVEQNDFDDWISGRTAAPGDVQKIIAGTLGSTPRELFSDIPPEDAGANPAKEASSSAKS